MGYLNLAAFMEATEAEGPGKRAAVWAQGCGRSCKGCCNREMQPLVTKSIVDTGDLFALIKRSAEKNGIEGVTLLGGEPVLQAAGMADLAALCQKNGLSVMLFSGFLYDELLKMNHPDVERLIANTDILVDGPFIEERYDTERAWVGSDNQKFYYLTDRYKSGIEYDYGSREIELRISEKDILLNGWPFM